MTRGTCDRCHRFALVEQCESPARTHFYCARCAAWHENEIGPLMFVSDDDEPPEVDDDTGTDDDSINADGSARYMVDR